MKIFSQFWDRSCPLHCMSQYIYTKTGTERLVVFLDGVMCCLSRGNLTYVSIFLTFMYGQTKRVGLTMSCLIAYIILYVLIVSILQKLQESCKHINTIKCAELLEVLHLETTRDSDRVLLSASWRKRKSLLL